MRGEATALGTGLEIRVGMGVLSAFYSSQSRSSEDSHEVMVVSQWGPQTGKVTGPGEASVYRDWETAEWQPRRGGG